jgi:hypothetical protein
MSSSEVHSVPSDWRRAVVCREVSIMSAVDIVAKKETVSDSNGAA